MRKHSNFIKTAAAALVAASLFSAGVYGADAFDTYTIAYRNTMANKGFDTDLKGTFTVEDDTVEASGNFKVDNSGDKTQLLLVMDVDGETVTQFSDGDYIYLDARGEKLKYPLGEKATQEDSRKDPEPETEGAEQAAPEFTASEFLKEFASCLEAGKIQEMGLLNPLEKNYVSKTQVDGDKYSLTVSDRVLSRVSDVLASSIDTGDDGVTVDNLSNFVYEVEIKDDLINSLTIGGTMDVTVPASISSTGEEVTYPLDLAITASFNDPGSQVTVEIPDTEGF